jgi:predicted transcriptional regulator
MSREELKELLHQKIDAIDSEELLEKVIDWLDINTGFEEPYVLTQAEKLSVQEGWEDYKKGDYITDEELDKEMDKWEKEADLEEPYILTKAENEAVQKGLEDYKNGRVTSHEDFLKEMEEWPED